MSSRECYDLSNRYVVGIVNASERFAPEQSARRWAATRPVIERVVEKLNQLDAKVALGTAALMIGYLLEHNPDEGHDLIAHLSNNNFDLKAKPTRQKRR